MVKEFKEATTLKSTSLWWNCQNEEREKPFTGKSLIWKVMWSKAYCERSEWEKNFIQFKVLCVMKFKCLWLQMRSFCFDFYEDLWTYFHFDQIEMNKVCDAVAKRLSKNFKDKLIFHCWSQWSVTKKVF